MTGTVTWTRRDVLRKHQIVMMRVDYKCGDTSLTVPTGLKKIYTFDVSPTSVSAKYVTAAAVSGGVITLTVADVTTSDYGYLYVTAQGI